MDDELQGILLDGQVGLTRERIKYIIDWMCTPQKLEDIEKDPNLIIDVVNIISGGNVYAKMAIALLVQKYIEDMYMEKL